MTGKTCEVYVLDSAPYQKTWEQQKTIANGVAEGTRLPTLLLVEHPHTYTFGRRGHAENLLWNESERDARGIAVHWVDRGGDVTYHGPGQLVGYPIIPLSTEGLKIAPNGSPRLPQADYVGYVRKLEAVLIHVLADFGLICGQIEGQTGVWIQPDVASRCRHCPPEAKLHPAKIAAIGIKVDARGITRHGFALNVAPDMSYWDGIIGCGLDAPVVSMADLLWEPPTLHEVRTRVIYHFGALFKYTMELVDEK